MQNVLKYENDNTRQYTMALVQVTTDNIVFTDIQVKALKLSAQTQYCTRRRAGTRGSIMTAIIALITLD